MNEGFYMAKYDLPDWVSVHKTKGRTIKVKNEKYYLYEQKCLYDKEKKHKHRNVDKYLGRITKENGFIPVSKRSGILPSNTVSKVYGPFLLITHCCIDILERLKQEFGDYANFIFTIASLRAIEKTPYYDLEDAYINSYFSVFDKTLPMSKSSLSEFLVSLSKHKNNFISFMKRDIDEDEVLIFDGTNLLCGSQNISYSGVGYKHGHNYKAQVNQLYAYSPGKRKMVYFRLLEGSVPDSKSLSAILEEANIINSVAVIDNGFASNDNIRGLLDKKDKYILALRRDSKYVTDEILNDGFRSNAHAMFTNNHESIFAYEVTDEENNRICIYFNQTIAGVETSEYLDKIKLGWKGYNEANFKEQCKRFGIYVIKTNADYTLQKTYEYYKSRFEIEYLFDTVKNTLEFDKVYMHSDASLESWAFINHVSILITQKIYNILSECESNYSFHSTFKKLRQVIKQRNILDSEEIYSLQVIPKKTKLLLEKLGIIP